MGRRRTLFIIVIAAWIIVLTIPFTYAQNLEQKYLLVKEGTTYSLTLSITPSLYEYYQQKDHQSIPTRFASYVTPYSLALVAEDIRSIFPDEEGFVNAVLMLVHQIPYVVVSEAKYPVETLVENEGDCDLLSYIAASLLTAQDLDVVLLFYDEESHMNIGVRLPNSPKDVRTTVSYIEHRGNQYYVAECTGNNWREGWRVGECPPELEDAQATVITLENCEQMAPNQVSSSFGTMEPSTISLTLSSKILLEGGAVDIIGQISASNSSGVVTLYTDHYSTGWISIGTADLDSQGEFIFSWIPRTWGQLLVKVSWSGNNVNSGTDSTAMSIYVIPKFMIVIGGLLFMIAIIFIAASLQKKKHIAPDLI